MDLSSLSETFSKSSMGDLLFPVLGGLIGYYTGGGLMGAFTGAAAGFAAAKLGLTEGLKKLTEGIPGVGPLVNAMG